MAVSLLVISILRQQVRHVTAHSVPLLRFALRMAVCCPKTETRSAEAPDDFHVESTAAESRRRPFTRLERPSQGHGRVRGIMFSQPPGCVPPAVGLHPFLALSFRSNHDLQPFDDCLASRSYIPSLYTLGFPYVPFGFLVGGKNPILWWKATMALNRSYPDRHVKECT